MPTDFDVDIVKSSWTVVASALAGLATATKAAEGATTGAGRRNHVIVRVDASYSTSTQSGLLEVKFGTTTIAQKMVHGAGAWDGAIYGMQNPTSNQAVSAELQAGAGGVTGYVTLTGFSTGPNE